MTTMQIAATSGLTGGFGERSGETGIRTLGHLAESPVFKTGSDLSGSASPSDAYVGLKDGLGALSGTNEWQSVTEDDPDLQCVIRSWPQLAGPIRSAILTLVSVADPSQRSGPQDFG